MKKIFIALLFCGCYSTDRKLEHYDFEYAQGFRRVSTHSNDCPDVKFKALDCLPVQARRCPFDLRPDCLREW